MRKDKQDVVIGLPEIGISLGELVRRGARQVIQQVIELELAALLEQYANVRTLAGKKASYAMAICPSATCSRQPGRCPSGCRRCETARGRA